MPKHKLSKNVYVHDLSAGRDVANRLCRINVYDDDGDGDDRRPKL